MDYKVYPFFKSHFSLGRSILTLGDPPAEPKKEEDKLKDEYLIHPDSIIDICKKNNMEKFFLIDDTISGFLEAKLNAEKADLQLIFGLRLTVLDDCTIKDEASKKK
jgi:Mg2+ and Co2+ transporter CorA